MQIKSGYKTTEFWVTIISQIVGLLVLVGKIDPNQANTLVAEFTAVIGGIIMITPAITYIVQRTWLKSQVGTVSVVTSTPSIPTDTTVITKPVITPADITPSE